MKRNKLFILGICTVMVALVSLSLVSGTWAKYTSTVSGSDSARVAKWEFEFNGDPIDLASAKKVTFNLFNTVKEADTTTTENNVKPGTGDEVIIAPGTGGSFQFTIANNSEVYAGYEVSFTEANTAGIPVQYSLDGSTWEDSIEDLSISVAEIAYESTGAAHTVYWRWAFVGGSGAHAGQTDETDTALGIKTTLDSVQVTMTVVFTQVD